METRIRVRVGDLEVECVGDESFVLERAPKLISELVELLRRPCDTAAPSEVPDASTPDSRVLVSLAGTVRDYWTTAPIAGADITIVGDGIRFSGRSDDGGRFVLSARAAEGRASLVVGGPTNYIETIEPFDLTAKPVTRDAFAVTTADVNRQYISIGKTPVPDSAIVIVHLLDAAGGPLEMVPLADISLIGVDGRVVGDGPYLFGASGDLQDNGDLSVSRAFDGRARAAFLDVPAGAHTLQVTARSRGGGFTRTVLPVEARGNATVLSARILE
jgi:hypothetical protein